MTPTCAVNAVHFCIHCGAFLKAPYFESAHGMRWSSLELASFDTDAVFTSAELPDFRWRPVLLCSVTCGVEERDAFSLENKPRHHDLFF